MITTLKSLIRKDGIKKTFKYLILRFLGLEKQNSEINTLFYFLNHYVDITSLPPTEDLDLRNLQLCDTLFLKIIDEVMKKYNAHYWLDFGTSLGAIRHRGFIPWDDDLDIGMEKGCYENFLKESVPYLESLGIEVKQCQFWVGLGYKHEQTGIWIDIFPYEVIAYEGEYQEARLNIKKCIQGGRTITNYGGKALLCLHNDDATIFRTHPYNQVYPVAKGRFENIDCMIASDIRGYVSEIYGEKYMEFPRTGVEHHGTGQKLSQLALCNNIRMDNILLELEGIYNLINK